VDRNEDVVMTFRSVSPLDGSTRQTYAPFDELQIEAALASAAGAAQGWGRLAPAERCRHLESLARVLRERREDLARLITREMGKLIGESRAEVEKCAWVCEYYAAHAGELLVDEFIETDAGRSYVAYEPLGTVLAVMPWNFPLWQVFRCAAPALAAGNTVLLKHAANVPECALAVEEVMHHAGLPAGSFRTLLIPASGVARVIEDPRVHAVSLTGSEAAGRAVASAAGASLKKSVLELGGSDPFIVLEDADLDHTVQSAVLGRFQNAGQSCIAAKRFIPVEAIAREFLERFRVAVETLRPGDPEDEATTLAPLARHDLRDELHRQVLDAVTKGATAVTGCAPGEGPGAFYQPSILSGVRPDMRVYHEEVFGPVALVLPAADEEHALEIANATRFGLGGSVWTRDTARGERLARRLQCGAAFVNGIVKSDPRLPFGGVKSSGYGRELSRHGIHEFVSARTVWVR
jgi:succinate-semialdehyde dehydrogenase / glutarate-semialdehyde dehydrogenase